MRIAHLSDLHLLSLDQVRFRDFLNKRWTGGMNLLLHRGKHYRTEVFEALVEAVNAERVDQVVCTGDLTNLALESEFRFARSLFDRLRLGPAHVTCIPGNHDAYVAESAGAFEATMEPYCTADADWAWPAGDEAGRWPLVRVRGEVAIVALTSCYPTAWFMAHGSVGAAQLERLERVLTDPRLADKSRLVMIHHPPAGARARNRTRGLRDHDALAQVLARTGAELVVHGHEHLHLEESLAGPSGATIPVRGVESGSYDGDKPHRTARYRVYRLADAVGRLDGLGPSRGLAPLNEGAGQGGRRAFVEEGSGVWSAAERRFVVGSAACSSSTASPS